VTKVISAARRAVLDAASKKGETPVRGIVVAVALAAVFSGCTEDNLTLRDATAKEVPIRFAHGEIRGDRVTYLAVADSRRGTNVRRAVFTGGRGELAIFDLMGTLGDYAFSRRATSVHVEAIIKDDAQIEWGASGDIHEGARQTGYQAFRLPADRQTLRRRAT
jgi:hypothetical protein